MKSKRMGLMGVMALSIAGAMGTGQVIQAEQQPTEVSQVKSDFKATPPKLKEAKTKIVNEIGGIPLMQTGEFGLTPREYGLRFGNGSSRKGKRNFQRFAHNSKVGKRTNNA